MQQTHFLRRRGCQNAKNTFSFTLKHLKTMKKILFFSLTLLIINFLVSCNKDGIDCSEARLQGRLLEKGSKKPLSGWTVYFSSSSCELLVGCSGTVRDSTLTDADGNYSYTYDIETHDNVFAFPKVKEGYFQQDYRVLGPFKESKVMTKDIEVVAKAWIKFHVVNEKPFDQFDQFILSGKYSANYDVSYPGPVIDKYNKALVEGNDSINVSAYITKNSINYIKNWKIWSKAHDTTFFEIKY